MLEKYTTLSIKFTTNELTKINTVCSRLNRDRLDYIRETVVSETKKILPSDGEESRLPLIISNQEEIKSMLSLLFQEVLEVFRLLSLENKNYSVEELDTGEKNIVSDTLSSFLKKLKVGEEVIPLEKLKESLGAIPVPEKEDEIIDEEEDGNI